MKENAENVNAYSDGHKTVENRFLRGLFLCISPRRTPKICFGREPRKLDRVHEVEAYWSTSREKRM